LNKNKVASSVLFYDFFIGNPAVTDTAEIFAWDARLVRYFTLFQASYLIRIHFESGFGSGSSISSECGSGQKYS
jgi:hypothetical protein